MGTIGWLILMYIVGGWLSVNFYCWIFVVRRSWLLFDKGDKEGSKAVLHAAKGASVDTQVFEFFRDHPDLEFPILRKCPVLVIFCWPLIGVVWMKVIGTHVQKTYEERLKVLEEKAP